MAIFSRNIFLIFAQNTDCGYICYSHSISREKIMYIFVLVYKSGAQKGLNYMACYYDVQI